MRRDDIIFKTEAQFLHHVALHHTGDNDMTYRKCALPSFRLNTLNVIGLTINNRKEVYHGSG